MNTKEIENAIAKKFDYRKNIIVPNVSWGLLNHEADVLVCSKSGTLTEIEIKRTKSDFLNDFKKEHCHHDSKIKCFYYAIPANLLEFVRDYLSDEVENLLGEKTKTLKTWAGIIVIEEDITETYRYARFEKYGKPKKVYNKLTKDEILHLAHLGTMRIWD
jgi:hypothetical protein